MVHLSNRLCPLLLRFLESASSRKNHKASDGHLQNAQQANRCKPSTRRLQCSRVYRLRSLAHRNTLAVAHRILPFHKPTIGQLRINEATANRLCRVLHSLMSRVRLYSNQKYALQIPPPTAHIPQSLSRVRAHVYPLLRGFQPLEWLDRPHIVPIHNLLGPPFSRTNCRLRREPAPPEASTPTHNTPMPKPSSKFKETLWR